MTVSSAPGKVIISGEHSVVYGKHAIVSAIDLRCYVNVEKADRVKIESELGKTGIDFKTHPYISWCIKLLEEKTGKNIRPHIKVKSQIPVASGLGSSAAVTVATIFSICKEYEIDFDLKDVYELSKEVEIKVQGKASGVDSFVSTYGKSWLMPEKEEINLDYIVGIVNTGESSITAEMVKKVWKLKEKYPSVVNKIFDVMDGITLELKDSLVRGDKTAIFDLFRMNQSMLKAIGVSTEKIDEIVSKFEKMGYPSKLTGAGGGGCVIAIFLSDKMKKSNIDGMLTTSLGAEGVREEIV